MTTYIESNFGHRPSSNSAHSSMGPISTSGAGRSFLDGADLDLGCRPSVHRRSGELVVEVYATMSEINGLRTARSAAAVTVNVIENATEVGRSRQTEVGRQNRFATQQVPRGLGIKE